jgi:hypothetical protein
MLPSILVSCGKPLLPVTKSNRAHVTIRVTVVPGYFLSYRVFTFVFVVDYLSYLRKLLPFTGVLRICIFDER